MDMTCNTGPIDCVRTGLSANADNTGPINCVRAGLSAYARTTPTPICVRTGLTVYSGIAVTYSVSGHDWPAEWPKTFTFWGFPDLWTGQGEC